MIARSCIAPWITLSIALSIGLTFAGSATAESMRCGASIVNETTSVAEILAKCGEPASKDVKAEDATQTIERMLKGYLAHRDGNETFLAFSKRHDIEQLKAMFDGVDE